MSDNPFSLWVYLSQTPLLWLTVTLLVYAAHRRGVAGERAQPAGQSGAARDVDHRRRSWR